jgi:hypothetical protein
MERSDRNPRSGITYAQRWEARYVRGREAPTKAHCSGDPELRARTGFPVGHAVAGILLAAFGYLAVILA